MTKTIKSLCGKCGGSKNTPYIEEFEKKDGIEMRLFVDLMIANQGNKEVVKERLDELLAFITKTIESEREEGNRRLHNQDVW